MATGAFALGHFAITALIDGFSIPNRGATRVARASRAQLFNGTERTLFGDYSFSGADALSFKA